MSYNDNDEAPKARAGPPGGASDGDDRGDGVIIIGAGAAGLTAAYDLKRKSKKKNGKTLPIKVLEANDTYYGGRVRKASPEDDDLAGTDFPIDLGGEWIHEPPKILEQMVDDTSIFELGDVKIRPYKFAPYYEWKKRGGWTLKYSSAEEDEILWKFVNFTWHDFFTKYIVPTIQEDLYLGCVVTKIDYSSSNNGKVSVTCQDGRIFYAQQVIVAVSLPILQQERITFLPPLPSWKQNAINDVPVAPGLKVFMEFSQKFYYNNFGIYKKHKRKHGEMYFYDESALNNNPTSSSNHKKNKQQQQQSLPDDDEIDDDENNQSNRNILAVFVYGDLSQKYVTKSDEEIIRLLLGELDEAYKGRATRYYMRSVVQNWSTEPHILGTYSTYRNGMKPMYPIYQPLPLMKGDSNSSLPRIFFAGEHLPVDGQNYGYVTGASFSGRNAANSVLRVRGEEGNNKPPPFPWRIWFVSMVLGTICCGLEHFLFFRDV